MTGADLSQPFEREHSIEELQQLPPEATRPVRILDLCSGPGGVGHALRELLTKFDMRFIGVDIEDYSDEYPGEFIQADVSDLTLDDLGLDQRVDLVWASPPCQAYSQTSYIWHENPREVHPTIPELNVRETCQRLGRSYVIENVPGCEHLRSPIALNGGAFELDIEFERWFETSFPVPEWTDETGDDIVRVGMDSERELAEAKHVPTDWGKTAIRSAIPGHYVAYLLAHCPALPELEPGWGKEAFAEARSGDGQMTLNI